ncbi:hypothetical protein EDD85DRAFT_962691 [Armillaria nabsnona]|nr:hypothetical protein EDD85DRAFT_962691 [Armillaria nabsnona]
MLKLRSNHEILQFEVNFFMEVMRGILVGMGVKAVRHKSELLHSRLIFCITLSILQSLAILAQRPIWKRILASTYDFIIALSYLTDGAFPSEVSNIYDQFCMVSRLWEVMAMEHRSGQLHGISKYFPHCPPGSVIMHCPVCPEPGFNMEKGWEKTPPELCHLNQTFQTIDSNHHANKTHKNTNPDDVLQAMLKMPEEKSVCNYLKVHNKQDSDKFKNMEYSGVIAVGCPHVFIQLMVNMLPGERYPLADLAYALAIEATNYKRPKDYKPPPEILSYDCACQYSINLLEH